MGESKQIAKNRKALHNFSVLEKMEAGVALKGCEVKSIREGRVNIGESFVRINKGEAFLYNAHISPYSHASTHEVLSPTRTRKLLLHKPQIKRLLGQSGMKGYTIVPLAIYINKRGKVKIEIALCKGKKEYDKRQSIKRKDQNREIAKALRHRQKS